jgi:type IV secretory pathway VirB2 component (pilin)
VNWLFIVLVVVAVAMIAIAGFLWMIGGAEPEKQKLAGRMILGAVVGIIIAFLAQVIPNVVTGILL